VHFASRIERFKNFSYYNGMQTSLFLSFAVGGYSLYFILCFIKRVIIMPVYIRHPGGGLGKPTILRGPNNTYFRVRVGGRWYDLINEFDKFAEDHPDKVLSEDAVAGTVEDLARELCTYLACPLERRSVLIERFFSPLRAVELFPPYDIQYQLVVKNESSETCYMWGMVFDLHVFINGVYEPCPFPVYYGTGTFMTWPKKEQEKRGYPPYTWAPVPRSIDMTWGIFYMSKVAGPGDILVVGPNTIRVYSHPASPVVVFLAGMYPTFVSGRLPEHDAGKGWLTPGVRIYYPDGPSMQTTKIPIFTDKMDPETGYRYREYHRSWAPWLLLAVDVLS